MKRRKVKSQKEMSGPVITMPVLFFRPSMAAGLAAASTVRPLRDAGVFWRTLAPVMVTGLGGCSDETRGDGFGSSRLILEPGHEWVLCWRLVPDEDCKVTEQPWLARAHSVRSSQYGTLIDATHLIIPWRD